MDTWDERELTAQNCEDCGAKVYADVSGTSLIWVCACGASWTPYERFPPDAGASCCGLPPPARVVPGEAGASP